MNGRGVPSRLRFRSTMLFFLLYRARPTKSAHGVCGSAQSVPSQEWGYNQSLHVRSTGPCRFCSPALVALRCLVFLSAGHRWWDARTGLSSPLITTEKSAHSTKRDAPHCTPKTSVSTPVHLPLSSRLDEISWSSPPLELQCSARHAAPRDNFAV
jgi:hypothetical protein